jgi:hypothetical protein
MLAAGIRPPHGDDRAFGSIYAVLHRQDKIEPYGVRARGSKGNDTWGATIWRITPTGRRAVRGALA